jgi:hypothetical protein
MVGRMVGLRTSNGGLYCLGVLGLVLCVAAFLKPGLILSVVPAKWNCPNPFDDNGVRTSVCTYDSNKGWRYVMYTSGAAVFIMSVLRITVIRLKETPKFLLGEGKDEQLVKGFQAMAAKYNRPCSITVEMLDACGVISSAHGKSKFSISELTVHFRGLFATKQIGLSTCLIWLSWTLIGLAYPLFYVFLSTYLATRGADLGGLSQYDTWRNYALVNISSIFVSSALHFVIPIISFHHLQFAGPYVGRLYV